MKIDFFSKKENSMRIIKSILLIIIFLLPVSFGLSDVFIVYKSGECSVDVSGNGNWREAAINMELDSRSIIRTGTDGVVELDMDGELISIGSNRMKSVGDLSGKVNEKKKVGWLKGLKRYTKNIGSGEDKYTETALAGVRGAPSSEEELEWFDESDFDVSVENSYQQGLGHFTNGKYSKAISLFREVIEDQGIDAYEGGASFHLGLSLFNVMRFEEAVPYLKASTSDTGSDFYNVALMHLSVSHYFLKNYPDAIEGLTTLTAGTGELKPYALLMLGKCLKEVGEREKAEGYFLQVRNDYQGTELHDAAVQELGKLMD
jgi:TolA-binding protein